MPKQLRSAVAIPAQFETRDAEQNPVISGYFAVFGSPYEICPGVREFVDPHAFDDTLSGDIRALINHHTALVLGRTSANTLHLRVDSRGLFGEININRDDSDAMNLLARVRRGDVSQCSFGFDILQDQQRNFDNGNTDFIIEKVRLYEVSVVTFPAYEQTSVNARSAFDARREQIQLLRQRRLDEQKARLRQILSAAKK